ncbi:hypothetical protein A8C56_09735 [Niabella ginsenosidivorans]|uniref:Enoyl reductase (ER) domain-containing protein n=1 Tax=Niabella ginsenosidivorans TaxID=1176587 RepID=A0A1A9I0S6_9BACT|nr:alcohol dehydrogenase catalytic domain-containing protein [Niabella ginsenosidivorans]ANH81226.1 hypothetical protein A8C56_09735 [Niabella ginsenosidivorans]
MKTLFYPKHDLLEITDQQVPYMAKNEVLIKVAACGICGSELETFKSHSSRRVPPLIMGHEFSGVIVDVGESVADWKKGDRVVSNAIVPCGHCELCTSGKTNLCQNRQVFGMQRNGAFAEYVNVPAHCLIPLPEMVPFHAACLAEPLANGVHLVKLSKHIPVNNMLIIGAGPIGLMALQAFRSMRQVHVFVADLLEDRLSIAQKLGASGVINPSRQELVATLSEMSGGASIDLVVDAVGSAQTNQYGLKVLKPGGVLLMIGLHQNSKSLESYDLVLAEKQAVGSYAATQEDMRDAVSLIASGKVDMTSWINYYNLENGITAFYDMMEAKGSHIKSVLVMEPAKNHSDK